MLRRTPDVHGVSGVAPLDTSEMHSESGMAAPVPDKLRGAHTAQFRGTHCQHGRARKGTGCFPAQRSSVCVQAARAHAQHVKLWRGAGQVRSKRAPGTTSHGASVHENRVIMKHVKTVQYLVHTQGSTSHFAVGNVTGATRAHATLLQYAYADTIARVWHPTIATETGDPCAGRGAKQRPPLPSDIGGSGTGHLAHAKVASASQ